MIDMPRSFSRQSPPTETSERAILEKEIITHAAAFVYSFEAVFHHDWDYTTANLSPANRRFYIDDDGTFVDPGVKDEAEDWGNRATLLIAFRELKALLDALDQITTTPDSTPMSP